MVDSYRLHLLYSAQVLRYRWRGMQRRYWKQVQPVHLMLVATRLYRKYITKDMQSEYKLIVGKQELVWNLGLRADLRTITK